MVSRRARAIVAYLALSPERAASRERLCGLFWGDRGESQARASLRQCLVALKDVTAGASLDLLTIGRERIALVADSYDCDVDALNLALAADDCEPLREMLCAIGAAPLLDDLEFDGPYRDWLDQTRARLDQVIVAGVEAHLSRMAMAELWTAVRDLADAFLRRDGLAETVVAAAIRADVAMGATASAHRRFQALESDLKREFGVSPGSATRSALTARADLPSPPTTASGPRQVDALERTLSMADPFAPPAFDQLLAVMAFDNLSPDRDMDFFSEGISEEILNAVTRTTDLRVVGRGSSFALRGPEKASTSVRAQLGATHALDGSVRRSGDRVRVSAHLTDCRTHTMVWSNRFDRDLSDVFALQDEIAEFVADALITAFAAAPRTTPLDAETLDLWFRARQRSPTRLYFDADLLEEVVRRAPDFAEGWSALAETYAIEAQWGSGSPSFAELSDRATRAGAKALALDPTLSGFEAMRHALVVPPCGSYLDSERRLIAALAASPNDARLMLGLDARLNMVGRNRLACQYAARAYALDPLNPLFAADHASLLAKAGQRAASNATFDRHLLKWPADGTLKMFAIGHAMDVEDWERVDTIARGGDPTGWHDAFIAIQVEESRRRRRWSPADTRERLAEMNASVSATGRTPLRPLGWLSAQGATDACYQILERASFDHLFEPGGRFDGDDLGPAWFDPTWAVMRRDPRFVDFCRRLRLCAYWLETDQWPDCVGELGADYDFKAAARAVPRAARP